MCTVRSADFVLGDLFLLSYGKYMNEIQMGLQKSWDKMKLLEITAFFIDMTGDFVLDLLEHIREDQIVVWKLSTSSIQPKFDF